MHPLDEAVLKEMSAKQSDKSVSQTLLPVIEYKPAFWQLRSLQNKFVHSQYGTVRTSSSYLRRPRWKQCISNSICHDSNGYFFPQGNVSDVVFSQQFIFYQPHGLSHS